MQKKTKIFAIQYFNQKDQKKKKKKSKSLKTKFIKNFTDDSQTHLILIILEYMSHILWLFSFKMLSNRKFLYRSSRWAFAFKSEDSLGNLRKISRVSHIQIRKTKFNKKNLFRLKLCKFAMKILKFVDMKIKINMKLKL